jgi:hypothetical protein
LKIQTNSQKAIETLILLVLFGSTIFQSCHLISTSATTNDKQLDATGFSTHITTQYQNITYDEDLLVHNNQTFTIENSEFLMTNGTITVEDTSTLIIRNSKFTTNLSTNTEGKSIVLKNQANLIIMNTTVIFIDPRSDFYMHARIIVQNDAEANITHSTFQNPIYVIGSGNSVINVDNSTLTATSWGRCSGVVTFDDSTAEIENSTMFGTFVWDNSTVSIKDSVVWLVRTGGTTTIDIATSKVDNIETFDARAPKIYVEGSTVTRVRVRDASVLLVDSHAGSIEAQGNATVSIGWTLPLFGLVKMPYTWILYVQVTIVVAIGAIIFMVLRFLLRRRARMQETKKGREEKAQRVDTRQNNPQSHPRPTKYMNEAPSQLFPPRADAQQ